MLPEMPAAILLLALISDEEITKQLLFSLNGAIAMLKRFGD